MANVIALAAKGARLLRDIKTVASHAPSFDTVSNFVSNYGPAMQYTRRGSSSVSNSAAAAGFKKLQPSESSCPDSPNFAGMCRVLEAPYSRKCALY